MKKKGQVSLGGLPAIAIGFIVLAVVLVVGFIVVSELQANQATTSSTEVANESQTAGTRAYLAGSDYLGFQSVTAITVYNGSRLIDILTSGNWSLDTTTGLFNLTNETYIGQAINVTYTISRTDYTRIHNITDEGGDTLTNMSEQIPLLATVIIFAVIIAIVIGFFAFRGSGRGGSASAGGGL